MKRREFITLLGGAAAAWPLAARAQQLATVRVGTVSVVNPRTASWWVGFDERMRELGYIEGQNFAFEFINLNGRTERAGEEMKNLVARKVDVIIASGPEVILKAAVAATATLPIVMVAVDYDPFARGYVASLARPTGNVTGVFFQQIELAAKRVELLKEAVPKLQAATVFWDRLSVDQWQATRSAGATLGLPLTGVELREQPYDYEWALAQAPPDHRGALIMMLSPLFRPDQDRIIEFTLRHRMPSIFGFREWAQAGGLMSYGTTIDALYQLAATYVDKIARGAKPADLPIQQPTNFELAINLKTAKALGLEIPPTLIARANEVIE
jgi:putative tryptophan/tyrosine transport system substrate-binding protein